MGMLDVNTKLSVAQAVTATGDTASVNIYDAGSAAASDFGMHEAVWLNVLCSTQVTSGGAATVAAVLQDSDDASSWADVLVGKPLALAALVPGAVLMQVVPPVGLRRYTRVAYRVATAVLTAGKFEAYYSSDVQRNVPRPSGFTVA